MKVLFAISEGEPFAKSGGLGDIGGSLPKALNKRGVDVRVVMPKYSTIPRNLLEKVEPISEFKVELGWRKQYCGLSQLIHEGIHYYFIDNEYYFKRDRLYGYEDDGERFAFFSAAVLESLIYPEGFKPEIIHCHDWHTALVPLMLEERFRADPFYYGLKTIFTIHNLQYQGLFSPFLADDLLGLGNNRRAREALDFNQGINFLKSALFYADKITTVSPGYSREIQTEFFGEGLWEVIKMHQGKLTGILNGIDYDSYNPLTDRELFINYRTSPVKKAGNKTALQERLNLPINKKVPMLALIGRLVTQKGLDLLIYILDDLLQGELQLVILGTGEQQFETDLAYFAGLYPTKLSVNLVFDEALARKIYAAADILLMPSLFEPCGLSQMIAMRYGTVPLVREVGGLKDSVKPYNEYTGEGNGFSFANYNAHDFLNTIRYALKIYYEQPSTWKKIVTNSQKEDLSWTNSADKYLELYRQTVEA
ncbi:MAG: glycogen synthase GlgA [Bacillota bacterium]